jgi:chemotaxis family two-component system sensor histidine kinase/response regulator PixL
LRKILGHRLTEAGYEVILAEDGQVALDKLQTHPQIQLVICDIEMPRMNGFEFLRNCRNQTTYAQLPIVILSMSKSALHQDLAQSLGANAYFSKPYNEPEFLETLQSLLNG